ncbi:helix-turn-helix transcriptional regulator [Streptomyces sannanensis]|uniref:Helix-turn-helix transcriptional regulator n=1 Tax=Streptomyces sannanensis TaxID=285536 RepID=A0ABP6S3W5_9ACTN
MVRFSKHTVESVELGRRMPDKDFVERAEAALGETGALRRAAKHLSRQPGIAAWFRQWARLERVAVSLCTYECRLVPGLLQTEAYVRALCDNDIPPLTDEAFEATVAARMERQRLLYERPNTTFDFVIEEVVLMRRLGGRDITRSLLEYILEIGALRNTTIQIMPANSEQHACLAGPLQLLETSNGRWLAYSEGQENGRLISDPKEVSKLQMRYARLRSQALSPKDSVGLLEQMRGAL